MCEINWPRLWFIASISILKIQRKFPFSWIEKKKNFIETNIKFMIGFHGWSYLLDHPFHSMLHLLAIIFGLTCYGWVWFWLFELIFFYKFGPSESFGDKKTLSQDKGIWLEGNIQLNCWIIFIMFALMFAYFMTFYFKPFNHVIFIFFIFRYLNVGWFAIYSIFYLYLFTHFIFVCFFRRIRLPISNRNKTWNL